MKKYFLMQGYFQNHLFFKDSIEILKKSINLKRNTSKNSVSIHIRRGDYLLPENQNYFAKCSLDYYKNSILKLSKLINLDNHSFYIFSDDIDCVIKLNYKTIFRDSYDIRTFYLCLIVKIISFLIVHLAGGRHI